MEGAVLAGMAGLVLSFEVKVRTWSRQVILYK